MSPPVSYTKLDLLPHGVDRQGEEVPRLRDAIRRSQTSGSQIRRFPQRLENLVDQKRTKDCVQKVLYHLTGSFPRGYVVRVRCITTYNHGRGRITTDWYSWQAAYAEGDGRFV